jgi:hypothetical protein
VGKAIRHHSAPQSQISAQTQSPQAVVFYFRTSSKAPRLRRPAFGQVAAAEKLGERDPQSVANQFDVTIPGFLLPPLLMFFSVDGGTTDSLANAFTDKFCSSHT